MGNTLQPNPDGTYAMPDVVFIPLGNLQAGPSYRTQLRRMEELENSIRQFGVLTPLWVQPDPGVDNRYLIFAGHRRYEAAKKIARERCDLSLGSSITAQVAKYLVPCRVFQNLAKVQQGLLGLTENGIRHDPSTIDMARELQRIKALMQSENGRPVKVADILSMLGGKGSDRRCLGRREVYRLLRIGELDIEVAAAAKAKHIAADFLDQVTRLSDKGDQLELIRLICDLHLSRREVREIVNKRLLPRSDVLAAIAAQVAAPSVLSPSFAAQDSAALPNAADGNDVDERPRSLSDNRDDFGPETEGYLSSVSGSTAAVTREITFPAKAGLARVIEYLKSQPDVDLLRAGDVLESWAAGEALLAASGGKALDEWLGILAERGHDPGEMERLRAVLQNDEYSKLEVELMKLLFMYQGILPEHLPGYVRQIREARAESGWYQRLVGCFLELLALLDKLDEGKKVNAMARRLVDIVFHELFWVAAGYDPKLQYHVEKLPPLRKKEFAAK